MVSGGLILLLATATSGWLGICPERAWPESTNRVWRAPFAEGAAAFSVRRLAGAEGTVDFLSDGVRIAKTNSRGAIVVVANRPFRHVGRSSPRVFANVHEVSGDPLRSLGFLRIWSGKENLTTGYDPAYGSTPLNEHLIGTAPGGFLRKFAKPARESWAGPDFSCAIVVAGAPSSSVWRDWGAEDVLDADAAWKAYKNRLWRTGVRDHSKEISPEDAFAAGLAADSEHTAKVERRDGVSRLVVDGKIAEGVLYKGYGGPFAYCGQRMQDKADLRLQMAAVTLGGRKTNDPGIRPHWTRDGFDVTGAVERVRHHLRAAPESLFLLALSINPYPEFADDYPCERWIAPDGRPVRGHGCIVAWDQTAAAKDPKTWTLTSQFSPLWREKAKEFITALVDELKRTGLSKRIVGVHITGSHDGQFGMPIYDYSPHARAAYRTFLKERYGTPAALSAAWGRKVDSFESVEPPDSSRFGDAETGADFLMADRDRDMVDFQTFIHHGSVGLLEDVARHAKRCFGKDIVAARWCLSVFAGLRAGEFDFSRFMRSDVIDILIAQSCYKRRPPGQPIPEKRVTASFHENGKLFLSELDFEAFHRGPAFCRDEVAAMSWGYLMDYPMWESANRKATGQMIALRQGFWYYDMGGDYFDDDRQLADIRSVLGTLRQLVRRRPSAWRPSAAVVLDEHGYMFRNLYRKSYGTVVDERDSVHEQLALLEASGVPFETYLLDDFLRKPELAARYRIVFLTGMYEVDGERQRLLDRLAADGRTVVLGSGTGIAGGAERTGFAFSVTPRQEAPSHEIVPEKGYADAEVKGFFELEAMRVGLGAKPGEFKCRVRRPHRVSVASAPEVSVLARYAADGAPAIAARRTAAGGRMVAVCDQMGLTPDLFNRLVRESGGYAACEPGRVQVSMNGDFLSVHALRNGACTLSLPFDAEVTNLRSGSPEQVDGRKLALDLVAGGTYWFSLAPRGVATGTGL